MEKKLNMGHPRFGHFDRERHRDDSENMAKASGIGRHWQINVLEVVGLTMCHVGIRPCEIGADGGGYRRNFL